MHAALRTTLAPIALFGLITATFAMPVSADDPPTSIVLDPAVVDAIALDNALFAATDTSLTDPTGRQTISVSFFAGHIGPVSPSGSAHWTNTTSDDSDAYSVEIDIPAGGTPANGFSSFAGINFHHLPALPPANAPSFDFKPDRAALSGGSPRLVIRFSDGGNINLRPLDWVAQQWTSEGPMTSASVQDPAFATNWDNNGGTCGFLFETTYATARSCHAAATVVSAFIVSDSGWLNGPYVQWIDNIQYNGQIISTPPDNASN